MNVPYSIRYSFFIILLSAFICSGIQAAHASEEARHDITQISCLFYCKDRPHYNPENNQCTLYLIPFNLMTDQAQKVIRNIVSTKKSHSGKTNRIGWKTLASNKVLFTANKLTDITTHCPADGTLCHGVKSRPAKTVGLIPLCCIFVGVENTGDVARISKKFFKDLPGSKAQHGRHLCFTTKEHVLLTQQIRENSK